MRFILLSIRLSQLLTILRGTGLYVIPVAGFIIFLSYLSFHLYQNIQTAAICAGVILLICISVQTARNDKRFISLNVENKFMEVYFEYFFLTLPFTITALFTESKPIFIFFSCGLLFIPLLTFNLSKQTRLKQLSKYIPPHNFEWLSGFRKQFIPLSIVYLLALAFSWFKILPLFLLWFVTITLVSFYGENESLIVMKENGENARTFLKNKIRMHCKHLLILFAPVLLINLIFNPGLWLLILIFLLMQLSIVAFAICLKYTSYEPSAAGKGNNLILSLVSIGSLIPYLLPVPLIMLLIYSGRAQKNLKYYLDDTN